MTTLLELIDRISFLAAMPAIGGLFIVLGVLLVARRWQMQVLGMVVLYFFVGLLHTRVIRPEVALVKALIGWLISLTFYVTGRYLDERRNAAQGNRSDDSPPRSPSWLAGDVPLRVLVLLSVLIIAYAGSNYFPLPQVPSDIGLACYLLVLSGLFLCGMSEDPMRVGLGLLVFLAGFELFFGALESSLVVTGLLGATGFLLTLAITFMAVTHAVAREKQA